MNSSSTHAASARPVKRKRRSSKMLSGGLVGAHQEISASGTKATAGEMVIEPCTQYSVLTDNSIR
jgi:hypothetical protein